MVSDIERISDYCENISEFAETLYEKKVAFSEIGSSQLREMLDVCIDSYKYALEAFEEKSREKALKVIEMCIRDRVYRAGSLKEALQKAENERVDDGDIFCLGSLYLAGMVKKLRCV